MADYEIPNGTSVVDGDGNYNFVVPGDRLLIPSTRTGYITFQNLDGASGNRIIITNTGGQVSIIANNWIGIQIKDSTYIHLDGAGYGGVTYGFDLSEASNSGLYLWNVDYVEADHIICRDSGHGVRLKGSYGFPRDTMYDIYLHHLHVYDIGSSGMYLGDNDDPVSGSAHVDGLEVAYCTVERCGASCIKVKSLLDNGLIHHNILDQAGLDEEQSGSGLVVQLKPGGKGGDIYCNLITNCREYGIHNWSAGETDMYNNIIVDAGLHGLYLQQNQSNCLVYNNTIVDAGDDGLYAASTVSGQCYDNIIVGSANEDIDNNSGSFSVSNNTTGSVASVGFVDPDNNDFHLQSGSASKDAGSESGYAATDYDGVARPQGSDADIGAFEYVEASEVSTKPLPIKGEAYRATFYIFDQDGDLVSGAAGLDSEVSIDGGTFADCTNEATEIATSSGIYYLDLTADEMDGDCIAVIVKTTTTGAKTTPLIFYPVETSDIPVQAAAISDSAVDTLYDEIIEGTLTYRHIRRILLAALAGKSSGGGSPTHRFRDYADSKNRISATVDEDGNRTAITLAGP